MILESSSSSTKSTRTPSRQRLSIGAKNRIQRASHPADLYARKYLLPRWPDDLESVNSYGSVPPSFAPSLRRNAAVDNRRRAAGATRLTMPRVDGLEGLLPATLLHRRGRSVQIWGKWAMRR